MNTDYDDIFVNAQNNSSDQCHIDLSNAAIKKLLTLFSDKNNKNKLRITVSAGGCSGFQYDFELDENVKPDDLLIKTDAGELLIDKVSARFLNGAKLDHISNLTGESFRIDFPHVTSQCSCGVSFAP